MIRVLHVRPFAPDFETKTASDALLGDASADFQPDVRTIGRGGDWPMPALATLRLRRGHEIDSHDILHAWGNGALTIAALGSRSGSRIVYTPTEYPSIAHVRWLNAVMPYRDVNVVCPTDTMPRRFVERGVPIERCHLIRPGVDFAKVRRKRDEDLRARLGLRPDQHVTLAIGETTRGAGHDLAAFAVAVMNVMDRKNRLLVWGRGPFVGKLRRFVARLRQPSTVIATDVLGATIPFESLLSVADDALITADAPVSTLPIATTMAAGLPIVTTVSHTVTELLEDRHTALLVTRPTARLIAQRINDLRADPNLRWQISDMARTEAFEFFPMSRFLEQHRTLYKQVHGRERVELPPMRAGAGLRFHGRV